MRRLLFILAILLDVCAPAFAQSNAVNIRVFDSSGNIVSVADVATSSVRVDCIAGCAGGSAPSIADGGAFTTGVSLVSPLGAYFDDTPPADVASGKVAGLRMTPKRSLHINLRDQSGNEVGTVAHPLQVECVGGTCTGGGGGGGSSFVDLAAFTAGTSTLTLGGGVYNDGLANVTSGNGASFRITKQRAIHINPRDSNGNEIFTSGAAGYVQFASAQPVSGTVTANAGSGTFTVGGTVTANAGTGTFTNQQSNVTLDYDTGAGTQTTTLFGIALPANGGAVAGGTSTNPVRVDPTGVTTQPVSGTVTANAGSGTFTVSGTVTSNAGSGTFTTSDAHLPASGALGDALANPTTTEIGANLLGWDATNTQWRRIQVDAGTGTLKVDAGVSGGLTNNNAAPGANNLGVLPALANTAAPSYTNGNQVLLSTDLGGSVRTLITNTPTVVANAGSGTFTVGGTVTANAGSGTFNNQQSNKTTDFDTGAGTDTVTMFGFALPKSGGAVAGGTSTDPIRIDPTGTTTQPVSGTVTANLGTTNGGAGQLALDATLTGGTTKAINRGGQKGTTNTNADITHTPSGANHELLDVGIYDGSGNLKDPTQIRTLTSTDQVTVANASLPDGHSNITADYDTGAGTQTLTMFGIALPASGGAVAGGTSTNPVVVSCASGCTPGGSFNDSTAFTFGTSAIGNIGAVVDDVSTNVVAENSAGAPRMSGSRVLYGNLRNASGTEIASSTSAPSGSEQALVVRNVPSGTQHVDYAASTTATGTLDMGTGGGTVSVSTVNASTFVAQMTANTCFAGQLSFDGSTDSGTTWTFGGLYFTMPSATHTWQQTMACDQYNVNDMVFVIPAAGFTNIRVRQTTGGGVTAWKLSATSAPFIPTNDQITVSAAAGGLNVNTIPQTNNSGQQSGTLTNPGDTVSWAFSSNQKSTVLVADLTVFTGTYVAAVAEETYNGSEWFPLPMADVTGGRSSPTSGTLLLVPSTADPSVAGGFVRHHRWIATTLNAGNNYRVRLVGTDAGSITVVLSSNFDGGTMSSSPIPTGNNMIGSVQETNAVVTTSPFQNGQTINQPLQVQVSGFGNGRYPLLPLPTCNAVRKTNCRPL